MCDPVEIHRREVAQRIQMANSQGGWEGTHTDFKRELGSKARDLGKMLKHILAFANTPRRTDAYLIFGVNEDKDSGIFEHVGLSDQGFPAADRINDIVHQYTHLREIVIDVHHVLDGKRTPYIAIPLQYEGPYTLSQAFHGVGEANDIFCRYGTSSVRATERDIHRMRADWASWFLDCRYEKTATSLRTVLEKRFPRHTSITEHDGCIRMLYENKMVVIYLTQVDTTCSMAGYGGIPAEPERV